MGNSCEPQPLNQPVFSESFPEPVNDLVLRYFVTSENVLRYLKQTGDVSFARYCTDRIGSPSELQALYYGLFGEIGWMPLLCAVIRHPLFDLNTEILNHYMTQRSGRDVLQAMADKLSSRIPPDSKANVEFLAILSNIDDADVHLLHFPLFKQVFTASDLSQDQTDALIVNLLVNEHGASVAWMFGKTSARLISLAVRAVERKRRESSRSHDSFSPLTG